MLHSVGSTFTFPTNISPSCSPNWSPITNTSSPDLPYQKGISVITIGLVVSKFVILPSATFSCLDLVDADVGLSVFWVDKYENIGTDKPSVSIRATIVSFLYDMFSKSIVV